MIHPQTIIGSVSSDIGIGVFATAFIPHGTIVVVRDEFDYCFSDEQFSRLPQLVRHSMENYMYRDKKGDLVLGWDHARYMNHSCHSNTLMTAYNLEIAVRDIEVGEEICSDYGLLNVLEPYPLLCRCVGCREHLRLDDIDHYGDLWDQLIVASLKRVAAVEQPLWSLLTNSQREQLANVQLRDSDYLSVKTLKYRP